MVFKIDSDIEKQIVEWDESHDCAAKSKRTAIGGRLTYKFTPTGIGTMISVQCACGEKFVPDIDF